MTTALLSPPVHVETVSCPLCDESHSDTLALLLEDEDRAIRRIPSDDLLAECEHLARELMAARVDGDYGERVVALYRHRLKVIEGETARRRRLEQSGAPGVPTKSRIPDTTIREIKGLVDLVDLVAEDLGEIVWYRTNRAWFRCRHHGTDSSPSLVVYEDQHSWWCYGCSDGGDAFDWLIKARGMEWIQAVRYLADRYRIKLPTARDPSRKAVVRVK